jgi:ATP-dependent RNA helicase DeaD
VVSRDQVLALALPERVDLPAFASLGVEPAILAGIQEMGFTTPTPIQEQAVPALLAGRDLIGQARTGTGKTAAFGIPMAQQLAAEVAEVQGLVLCPTRELAVQVAEDLGQIGRYRGLRVVAIYGGQPIRVQMQLLARGAHIVVGTPGRVMDHMRRGTLNLGQVRWAVLDEADEMLDMGFAEDIELILGRVPAQRRTWLFSATIPQFVKRLSARYQRDPLTLDLAGEAPTVPEARQLYYEAFGQDKFPLLCRLLDSDDFTLTLIFCNTKAQVDILAARLVAAGYRARATHGDLTQAVREDVMARFRSREIAMLVATNVAARGLDIDDVSHVINYDLPEAYEDYVHRIGRTARAGKEGVAISLITPRQIFEIRNFERRAKVTIERGQLEGAPSAMHLAEQLR